MVAAMRTQRSFKNFCAVAVLCVILASTYIVVFPDRTPLEGTTHPLPDPAAVARSFPEFPCVQRSSQDGLPLTYFKPHPVVAHPELPVWQRHQKSQGIMGYPVPLNMTQLDEKSKSPGEVQTSDYWPQLSKNYYDKPIPRSPFHPNYSIRWDFDTREFLQRADVKGQPPKIITWIKKPRHIPTIPEPVLLRVCPEMPCRVTTNATFQGQSAALLWSGEHMTEKEPPKRSHPDQVFVFHNLEPPRNSWACSATFRLDPWRSAFNWTMHYRFDADILSLHGLVVKRGRPANRNYTEILAKKTKFAAWLKSSIIDQSKRKQFVSQLQKYISLDDFGESSEHKCPREQDDVCFQTFSKDYKFFLAFENSLCRNYISEKFFRYLNLDAVLVARGSNEYKHHAPPEIFINTADFKTIKDLADHLLYLDKHPEEYLQILKAKDEYDSLYEDYPLRRANGQVFFMHYQYEATAFCEMCRRLWNLDSYRQTIPDITAWFDKELCYPPTDLN